MNKVITINLNGIAYQLEEDGFEALRAYLDAAARRLEGNPDKAEIIADIEQSIGDKFRTMLAASKTVVVTKEVEDVIAEMGPVEDDAGETGGPASAAGRGPAAGAKGAPESSSAPGGTAGAAKRLYKVRDGAMIGGVCNGIAAFLGIDVTIVRIAFVFMAFMWGTGALLYVLMMIIIPSANTPAEKTAATGIPSTAEEFIRRAKAGYYDGMKTFRDKKAYREWKGQFKREMRQHKRDFKRGIEQNVRQWSQGWRQHWGLQPHSHDTWIAGSFLTLLITIVSVVGLCALLSLLLTGSIFTFSLPAGMPLWMAIILLLLIFQILKWPLKAARYSVYYHGTGGPGYCGHGGFFFGTLWWVAILLIVIWVANHHSVRAHEVLDQLRHESHQFVDSVRDWWDKP